MPDTSSSSIPKPKLDKGDVVGGWTVVSELGRGGFGSVFKVYKGDQWAACKTEYVTSNSNALKKEVPCLRLMQWSHHFCRLFQAGVATLNGEKLNVMIMTLVGMPLSKMRRQCPEQRFTRSTAIRLFKQCLAAVRDLHNTGFLHRDIKGGNFAWGDGRTVYLLDMGFARRYLNWTSPAMEMVLLRPTRKRAPFLGTSRYCSPNVHDEVEQGRRDDLWSLLYMLVEFIKGTLPWKNDSDRRAGIKKKRIGSKLLDGCPVELFVYYDHLKALDLRDRPNYDLMMRCLVDVCTRCDFKDSDPMDFEEGGRYYEHFLDDEDTSSEEPLTQDMLTDDAVSTARSKTAPVERELSSDAGTGTSACTEASSRKSESNHMEIEVKH